MRNSIFVVLWILIFSQSQSFAQDKSHPANRSDFVGVYQLLEFPQQDQPKVLKSNPWPAPCQFFGHYPSGYWLHQQSRGGACANAIPSKKPDLPQTVEWRLLKDGFVVVDRKDSKVQELWKIDRINKPTNLRKINLNEGDLIMQLVDQNTKQVIWIRLLRRVGNADNTY